MKSLTILVVALVITLVLNGPLQSFADPQLDTLVNIATQARSNLNISISQIPNAPGEIISLYKQGSDETDALTAAVSAQNVTSAKQHFLAAMNFFKTTNDKINSLNATETNDQQRIAVIQLQSEITRLEKIAETLQTIAITNHVDFNFTQFNTSLIVAKQDLDAGKINEASQSLDTANQLISDAHHSISEAAQQRTPDRAKDFAENQIERFDKISDLNTTQNVTSLSSNATVSPTGSNQTSVENPGEMVAKLRKLVAEGNVDEALKVIKSLDAYQKETEKNNDNQVESQSQTSDNTQNNAETNTTLSNVTATNQSNVTTTGNIKTDSSNDENSTQSHNDKKIERSNSFHDKNLNFSSTALSNVTAANLPIINKSNSTQSHKDKKTDHENSSHDTNPNISSANTSNVTTTNPPITNQSNVTTTGNIKTDSSNNENSIPSNKDKKTDQPSSVHNDNLNQQQNNYNKVGSQVIPQGNSDSEQQNKPHDKGHEKIQVKQNKGK
ncbi:MAG TPA: hypothetical protein VFW99_05525 [Candidatus Nitrosotalea sp.]|nr:hypothetical protein [Candidatus Nitrosotalea sp.]